MQANSIFDKIRNNPNFSPARSVDWFRNQIKAIYGSGQISSDTFLRKEGAHAQNKISIGDLLFFIYDAKTKDKLPYWDRFPLVYPFQSDKTSFLGLNLHYLPPLKRIVLMDKLLQTRDTNLSWDVLKNFSKFPGSNVCIKRYLFNHVKSKFIVIPQDSWTIAALLPTDNFQKASNLSVWANTRSH